MPLLVAKASTNSFFGVHVRTECAWWQGVFGCCCIPATVWSDAPRSSFMGCSFVQVCWYVYALSCLLKNVQRRAAQVFGLQQAVAPPPSTCVAFLRLGCIRKALAALCLNWVLAHPRGQQQHQQQCMGIGSDPGVHALEVLLLRSAGF